MRLTETIRKNAGDFILVVVVIGGLLYSATGTYKNGQMISDIAEKQEQSRSGLYDVMMRLNMKEEAKQLVWAEPEGSSKELPFLTVDWAELQVISVADPVTGSWGPPDSTFVAPLATARGDTITVRVLIPGKPGPPGLPE